MGTKLIIIPFMVLLLAFSVSAVNIQNKKCYDDGSFEITIRANTEKYAYTREMVISADDEILSGTWDNAKVKLSNTATDKYATFTGDENQLTEEKSYGINIHLKERTKDDVNDAELNFDLECPGLVFSCRNMGIKIIDCLTSKSGKFTSNLEIYGLEQSEDAKLDPLEVINFILDAQILYKDIHDHTSKRGSLPKGATAQKVGENQYLIESYFDKYTTNNVEKMWVSFNDNLKKPCDPADYPTLTLSHNIECEYKETEEDIQARIQEMEEKEQEIEKLFEEKKEEVVEEVEEFVEEEEEAVEEVVEEKFEEELQKTGFSIKDSGSSKKKARLTIMIFFLLGVVVVGGVLLAYLYKQGYFY